MDHNVFSDARIQVDDSVQGYGGYWTDGQVFERLVEEVGELARSRRRTHQAQHNPRVEDEEAEVCDILYSVLAYANVRKFSLTNKWYEVVNRHKTTVLKNAK